MKIIDLLDEKSIKLNLKSKNKPEVIEELVDLVANSGNLNDKENYRKAILAREEMSTTGIGEGVAIPHAKTTSVDKACIAAAVSKEGIDYESFDGSLSNLFFMIAAPDGANNTHLEVLSRLSTILMDEDFRNKLINSNSAREFKEIIDKKEREKFSEEYQDEEISKEDTVNNKDKNISKYPQVLAVTACPTGIAHTFMAAESLNKMAESKGISIKVETNGSAGVKNRLTKEEIKNATCIIVAADKNVEMARFDGKKVIKTKVADGIHKAEELIDKAVNGDAPIYHGVGEGSHNESGEESESGFRKVYKHLMNGVSNMLPFVIGGGILIALAFLLDDYSIDPSHFGSNTPIAAFFKGIGDKAFGFMLPVLAGYIAYSISDRPAFVVGFVGGALAGDGGSGFLGALLAGFIAGYLVEGLKKIFNVLPTSLEGIKPVLLYPLFGTLLMGVIMTFLVIPPVTAINNAMVGFLNSLGGTSKIVLGLVLGGMMAVDMGGPVNKAAYVFGVASLESGQFEIMAAVMAGGMVPPLAIALATTFFKNRFTKEERESGKVNYVMGLSFVTEGAIPFAAGDPLHVIPACVGGSAVAGALSMLFNAALRAPHGGVFVIPVVTHPLGYIVAIIVGAIVGMMLLALLKKPLNQRA
ncbi:fructose-specific PTS transporter subunit EIIC [Clostridioides sp. ZZV14-6154]|uniref:PTS fructose transporter subunit IIABC n=1 Tax=unclassified Clostridioides TaxID=2635829 RepID=UPI001D12E7EB|nr:fructose-specific PTS transporter subunit EIIC [Clostridioides sp. ZZV15-6388]MCC0660340.1 fructose-specific PTS transporter subunit EIIC [Clostridioides sp. ZZV14-6154]MCC0665197.1 fructose-specific PTS transporter subunit EIIC [Clostridioides sp. ZZV15-6597]MCC0731136.1 fructose-specific PTS transporter subunit EIIC [Clostridioides sp. ZZV14-6048]MCC0733430.1 fructose-specific PTS transporter subunit EIIC [Clostridioides sp. ZZV14-6009]MCC0737036.1 fructose-specific PTS transporter subuni